MPANRVQVEEVADGSFRLCESDGSLIYSWLPGLEDPEQLPIDRGGFDTLGDATGFALAIDLIRAEHGMVDVTPAAIEKERADLDKRPRTYARRRDKISGSKSSKLDRALARLDALYQLDAPTVQLDLEALRSAVECEPISAPVVEYRRIRVA